MLLEFKASKDRGAASLVARAGRDGVVDQLEKMKYLEEYSFGHRITTAGLKALEKTRDKSFDKRKETSNSFKTKGV